MMPYQATALIGILMSLVTSSVADTCSANMGYPGVPGIPGSHGPNGKDGPKGLKGDHGDDGQLLKAQPGDPGLMGFPGRAGVEGDPGFPGTPGFPGPKGERGMSMAVTSAKKSYFSVKKFYKTLLNKDKPVEFEGAVVEGVSLNKGVFRSAIKGYYYFAYHVTGRNAICLNIKKGQETKVGFCDAPERGFMVTSGSVVLELAVGDEVSLQPTENSYVQNAAGADSIFTGFLLFAVS